MSNMSEWPPDDATVGLIVFQAIVGVIFTLMTFLLVGSFGNRVLWLIQLSHFLAWSLLLWGGRSWRVTVVLESYVLVSALILTILGDLVTLLYFPYSLIPIAVLLKTLRTKRARATVAVVSMLLFLIPLAQASLLPNARISFMQASPTILELLASSAVLAILTVVSALRPRRFTAGMALRVAAGARAC
jgi:nitrate reductase NapE component